VPVDVYDRTITTLRRAVEAAKLGNRDRLAALRRLDAQARAAEASRGETLVRRLPRTVDEHIEAERSLSHEYGGRTVRGDPRRGTDARQAVADHGDRPRPGEDSPANGSP
jgi:hypothetical protein